MARLFMAVFRIVIFLSLGYSLVHFYLTKKSFTFAHRDVHKVAEKYTGQPLSQSLSKLTLDLQRRYGAHILPAADQQWVTFSAGGLQGKLLVLHASLTEYLLVFGSPMPTTGNTGFQWVNQSCSVLSGSVQRLKEGALLDREEFTQNDYIRTQMFQPTVAHLSQETWLLCYGRGFLPLSAPYAIVENLFLNWDVVNTGRFIYATHKAAFREASLWIQESYDYYLGRH